MLEPRLFLRGEVGRRSRAGEVFLCYHIYMSKIFPQPLQAGDQVGIATPSSPIPQDRLDLVVQFLRNLDLQVRIPANLQRATDIYTAVQQGRIKAADQAPYDNCGYAAGSPERRVADIMALVDARAIFFLRGGYTSLQLLPKLFAQPEALDRLAQLAPAISGYSDITPLINAIHQATGLVTYHAPMVTPNFTKPSMLTDGQPDQYSYNYWYQFMFTDWHEVEIKNPAGRPLRTVVPGQAAGDIVGGNLEELHWLIGTPHQLDLHGKILFLEDVEVPTTNLDVDLAQMYQSGMFDGVQGVILGDFVDCPNSGDGDLTGYESFMAEQLVIERLKEYLPGVPLLAGLAIGHALQTATIPIGAHCELDATARTIKVFRY